MLCDFRIILSLTLLHAGQINDELLLSCADGQGSERRDRAADLEGCTRTSPVHAHRSTATTTESPICSYLFAHHEAELSASVLLMSPYR